MNTKAFQFVFLLVAATSFVLGQSDGNITTTAKTNTTTAIVTTTTVAPPNTTATTAPTNTTVPSKNTTTPAATTTTPAPTTTPADPQNKFVVKDGNVTCIKMIAEIDMVIPYEMKTKNTTVKFDVPKNPKTEGTCGNDTQTLSIMFKGWKLTYEFTTKGKEGLTTDVGDDEEKTYHVGKVTFVYTMDDKDFPGTTTPGKVVTLEANTSESFLKATTSGYYVCDSKSSLDVEGMTLNTKNLKYKAFNSEGDADLTKGTVAECSADEDTNSIVPIAVGAALAGLVVIVLIAYLIGRKRTRKTGYESV